MALYDEIGGAAAVRAALDAFYPRVLADATLSPFFKGVNIERLKQTQEGFFAMALGGPNAYTGRSLVKGSREDDTSRTKRRSVRSLPYCVQRSSRRSGSP